MKEIEGLVDLGVDGELIVKLVLRNMVSMSLFLLTRVRDQLHIAMKMQTNFSKSFRYLMLDPHIVASLAYLSTSFHFSYFVS